VLNLILHFYSCPITSEMWHHCRGGSKGMWRCRSVLSGQGSELVSGASQERVIHCCDLDGRWVPGRRWASNTSQKNDSCNNSGTDCLKIALLFPVSHSCLHLPRLTQCYLLGSSPYLIRFIFTGLLREYCSLFAVCLLCLITHSALLIPPLSEIYSRQSFIH